MEGSYQKMGQNEEIGQFVNKWLNGQQSSGIMINLVNEAKL